MNSIKPVEELTFTDDFMFTTIMKDKEICKELLERLLKIKVTEINYPVAQKSLAPFFETKGVRLDVYVDDGKRVFDIEIQTYIPEAIGKRMRYYQSILDMDSLQKGSVYTELKETYILFICTNDPFGRDLPVYTFKNRCIEDGEVSNDDKSTKVIYNATSYAKEKDSQIRAFLQYLCNRSSTDDFTNKIDKQVEHFKLSERFKGDYMFVKLHEWEMKEKAKKEGYEEGFESGREKGIQVGIQQGIQQGIERGIEQGIQKGISEGAEQKAIETAKNLLTMNLSLEQIAQATSLPLEKIQELEQESKQQ
jgi:predicted transposase/invertase (TIGR01784 family)